MDDSETIGSADSPRSADSASWEVESYVESRGSSEVSIGDEPLLLDLRPFDDDAMSIMPDEELQEFLQGVADWSS